jgi:hypothetical protein
MSPARPPSPTTRVRALIFLVALAFAVPVAAQEDADPPARAARINLTEGAVSLQPSGTDVWTNDILNRPFASGDRLWSDRESRAEVHVGSSAIRLGSESGVEVLGIDDRSVQLKQTAGTLSIRVRALGPDETFEIDTPTAALSVLAPGEYRIDIDEQAGLLRVAALSGQIAVTAGSDAGTVRAGGQAEYSPDQGIAAAEVHALSAGDAFDRWVEERDRREDRSVAPRYVSRETTGYEDLDDYGSWQTIDDYGPVWTPVVAVGWAPYRNGHWAWVAPWGWTWVDAAPWGFAPFHYGRWISLGGRWCWTPGPRRAVPVYAPALVGWVGRPAPGVMVGAGPAVGWFPLGWNEVYVPSYRVSTTYVRNVNVTNIHVTNEYITRYVGTADRPVMGGAPAFRNQAIPGAVTATTRAAFTGAERVEQHRLEVMPQWRTSAAVATAAPPIAPSLASVGRRAPVAPRIDASLWGRPVIARVPPPAAAVPFEQQRRAVIANGGQAVPAPVFRTPRADVIRPVAALPPPVAPRVAAPAEGYTPPARGAPSPRPDYRNAGQPARPAPAAASAPAERYSPDRPAANRPPVERTAPTYRPPESRAPVREAPRPPPVVREAPEPRAAPREAPPPPPAPSHPAPRAPEHTPRNDPRR